MANAGIGVTIGSHTLRAVAVRKKGEAWFVTKAISQRAEEGMRSDAGRILAARGLRGVPVTLGLSGKDVIIRYNQVPPVPEWRLRNLMKFEVLEVSGQSGGAVCADYRKLNLPDPEGTRGEDTVLVALARNAYLEPLLQSLEAGGLKFDGGCPNSVALFDAFAVNATYREDETCLLVHVGAQGMDLALERGGELIFARNASPGGKAFTEAIAAAFATTEAKAETLKTTKADVTPRGQARYPDATSEKVANAIMSVAGQVSQLIQSTLMIGRAQTKLPDLKVDRVWLAGGGASLKGLDAYLKQAMGVPVERFNPFESIDLSELDPTEKAEVEAAPHEYAVALGLAQSSLAPAAFKLSVIPEGLRKKREFATKGVFAIAAGVVAIGALAILYTSRTDAAAAVTKLQAKLRRVEEIAAKDDKSFGEALVRLEEVQAKHRLLAEIAAPGPLLADAIALLESKLKDYPDVYLEETTLTVEDPVRTYELLHKAPGNKGGYSTRVHSQAVRTASVHVVGRVSPGPSPVTVYNAFVQACRANDKRLLVMTKDTFQQKDGRFQLDIHPGVLLHPIGRENPMPWVLREPTFAYGDGGAPEGVTGTDVEGIPITIAKDRINPQDWEALAKELPAKAPGAPEKGEAK